MRFAHFESIPLREVEIDAIFSAQVENVRELVRAWKHINSDVNRACLKSQHSALGFETKLLALVYCALAEAMFSKLIHTPNALSVDEIHQIKKAQDEYGIREGWKKCIELSLKTVDAQRSSHPQNVRKKLGQLVDDYIYDPGILRNKIAHGQWVIALNREHTAVNKKLTGEIAALDVVELYRRKHALEMLCSMVEDLIKSPNKSHQRDYWQHLIKLEDRQKSMQSWSMEAKYQQLKEKRRYMSTR